MAAGEVFCAQTQRSVSRYVKRRIRVNSIVLGSPLISGVVATLIVLVVGDFASTFFYHVPQHVWGKLHLRTHHDRRRSYWDHAVLSRSPEVLLDGLLGALPYIAIGCVLRTLSVAGAILGLCSARCTSGGATPRNWAGRARPRVRVLALALASCCPKTTTGTTSKSRNRVRRHLSLLRCAGAHTIAWLRRSRLRSRRAVALRGCVRAIAGAPLPCAP